MRKSKKYKEYKPSPWPMIILLIVFVVFLTGNFWFVYSINKPEEGKGQKKIKICTMEGEPVAEHSGKIEYRRKKGMITLKCDEKEYEYFNCLIEIE